MEKRAFYRDLVAEFYRLRLEDVTVLSVREHPGLVVAVVIVWDTPYTIEIDRRDSVMCCVG